jgi:hypothetical protein
MREDPVIDGGIDRPGGRGDENSFREQLLHGLTCPSVRSPAADHGNLLLAGVNLSDLIGRFLKKAERFVEFLFPRQLKGSTDQNGDVVIGWMAIVWHCGVSPVRAAV